MAKGNRPRHGSKAYHPRKRSNRIYPSLKNYEEVDEERIEGFIGYKAGMAHVMALDTYKHSPSYGQEIQIPVTIIECPKIKVHGVRVYTKENNSLKTYTEYYAENIDKEMHRKLKIKENAGDKEKALQNKDKIKEIRLITHTQPKKAKLKKKPETLEIPIQGPNIEKRLEKANKLLGKEITIKDVFKEGSYTDIIAVTKGKGTQGPLKRFGLKKQERKAKKRIRHPGSIGSRTPGRVLWTVPMSGQTGYHKRTELNKRILKIGEKGEEATPKGGLTNYGEVNNEYILIKGSVPGPKKRPILLRHAVRPPKETKKPEVNYISTQSE